MANTRQARSHTGSRIAVGVILIVVSLFCFLSIVGAFGLVGRAVYSFFCGFFGLAAYAYTIIGVILGIAVTFGIRPRMRFSRALLFFGMLIFAILALQVYTSSGHIIGASYGDYLHNCYANTNTAGGLLFGLAAFPIMKAITAVGALVVSCAAFFVLVLIAIFPSIRRNVTYDAPSRRERKVKHTKESRSARSTERRTLFPKKQNTEHLIEATSAPVITDLSQTQTDPLYVVDVEGDPMPQRRNRKAKGADGYQPLSTFNPLYPNRNGGYEDEVIAPQRQPDTTYVNMSTQDMARDILFGQNPSDEIISRFNDARNQQTNNAPIYNNARRNEMRAQFGVPQESMREEFISRFRAPKQEEAHDTYPQAGSPIHLQEGQVVGNISSQTNSGQEQPIRRHDFFSLQEEQNRLFMTTKREDVRNMFGQPKPVVQSDRVMPRLSDADAINSTIRKAEDAVSGGVNVGVLGALNLAKSGGEVQNPVARQEIVSEAYTEPQIPVQPQMPVQSQAPVQQTPAQPPVIQRPIAQQSNQPFGNQTANQPFGNQPFAQNQYSAPQSVIPPVVSAKPRDERKNENATLIKNGQPTTIEELEKANDRKMPGSATGSRLFSEPYVDGAPKNDAKAEQQKQQPKYEMLKPTLDNPRPAYVDTNPTQGGAMPSEPAPVRQQVTAGEMSRAAIQGTTDIAKQSGKDKESAEMQARIQNIRQTMKETPNLNQYERDSKLREEKVRSSQNRGLQNVDTKKVADSSKKANDTKYAQVTVEEAIEKTKPRRPYTAPPVSLLKPPVADVDQGDDYELRKERILSTLSSFGITGEVIEVQVGPTFTLYKLHVEMPRGRTISYISSLENDISMKIEAESVRIIAPIPGQDAVGIEVPNKNRRAVNISEIIESPEFNKASDPCTFVLGKDIENKGIVSSVDSLPHVLIAGATGAGKSCGINSLIVSLLYKASPDDVRFILVDPKRVELSVYAGIPHLLMDEIICDADKAIRALTWAEQEMRRRMKFFGDVGYRNIENFNAETHKHGYEKMPRIMVIVDEFADLMSFGGKTVESLVNSIARLARAVGIHLVLATQRPSTDVISGTIKNNFPSRVAFKVTSSFDSKTILDSIGAEKLLGKGDMIFMKSGKLNQRIQGAFISENEVKDVVDFVKEHNDSFFDSNVKDAIFNEPEEEKSDSGKKGGKSKDSDVDDGVLDDDFFKALEIGIEMKESGKSFSISYLQRKLSVGFNKAAGLVDKISEMGYLTTSADKPNFKYVNITEDELDELRRASMENEDEE